VSKFERLAAYTRLSNKERAMDEKIEAYLVELRAHAKSEGWTITEEYVDPGITAASDKVRPEFQRMLAAIRANRHDAVLSNNMDRLTRYGPSGLALFEACKAGGVVDVLFPDRIIRLDTADGRREFRDSGSAAQHQSERASERIRKHTQRLANLGEPKRGGVRAFGFEPDGKTIREDEAALIGEAAQRIIKGGSVLGVVKEWHSLGIRTPITGSRGGNEWGPGNLRRMLLSPRNAALRVHQGEVIGEAVWPAILDRKTYKNLKRVLENPKRLRPSRGRRYLLRGMLYCGVCGTRLISRPRPGPEGTRRYICSTDVPHKGCGRVGTIALPVEEYVCQWADSALGLIAESPFADPEFNAESEREQTLYDKLRGYEERRKEFSEHRAEGVISRDDYRVAIARIDADQKAITRELAKIQRPARGLSWAQLVESARPFGDPAEWSDEDWQWWRSLIEATTERVIIQPSTAPRGSKMFDTRRIEIVAASGVRDYATMRVEELKAEGRTVAQAKKILKAEGAVL
jgi:site-specific DNA recombinase